MLRKDNVLTLKTLIIIDIFYSIFCATVLNGIVPLLIILISFFIINGTIPNHNMIHIIKTHNSKLKKDRCQIPSITTNGFGLSLAIYCLTLNVIALTKINDILAVNAIVICIIILIFCTVTIIDQIRILDRK